MDSALSFKIKKRLKMISELAAFAEPLVFARGSGRKKNEQV
jgi:hypothetical protein